MQTQAISFHQYFQVFHTKFNICFPRLVLLEMISFEKIITTVFVHTRLWKTKHPRKRIQNSRQSCVLLTDRIEIHQLQPASIMKRRSEGHTSGCDWWISIGSVDNTQDCRKFWKHFHGCLVFQSRVSTKTVVKQ